MSHNAESLNGFSYAQSSSRPRRKRRNGKGSVEGGHPGSRDATDGSAGPSESLLQRRIRTVENRRSWLRGPSKVVQRLQATLETLLVGPSSATASKAAFGLPRTIIALGLGKVAEGRNAQIQLAWMLEVAETVSNHSCQKQTNEALELLAYDPVFDAEDKQLLAAFGITAASREDASARRYSRPTLLYMPHCPRPLCERYLRANWTDEAQLTYNLLLCCNRLAAYAESLPTSRLARESPCIWRALPHLSYAALPSEPGPISEALHDLGFHRFNFKVSDDAPSFNHSPSATTALPEVEEQTDRLRNELDDAADKLAMMTVVSSNGRRRQNRNRPESALRDGVQLRSEILRRPPPFSVDFWQLPEEVESEADKEIL